MLNILALEVVPILISSLLALAIGFVIGFIMRVLSHEKSLRQSRETVEKNCGRRKKRSGQIQT